MNEPTQSGTPRTDYYFIRRNDGSNVFLTDDLAFCRQLEKPLNRLCKMAGFEITKGDNEGTAAEKVSATIAKFKQIVSELDDTWKECEQLRLLVPTTAQHMVYHSLLMKYEALKNELNQWKECADRLVEALNDVNDQNEGMLVWDEKLGSALAHYNQLKQGEGK